MMRGFSFVSYSWKWSRVEKRVVGGIGCVGKGTGRANRGIGRKAQASNVDGHADEGMGRDVEGIVVPGDTGGCANSLGENIGWRLWHGRA